MNQTSNLSPEVFSPSLAPFGRKHRDERTLGSSDFDRIFENFHASCSFGLAKDI
jgi:hypothetical protein